MQTGLPVSARPLFPAEAIDPLASPALQRELPGILAAFDEDAMRAHLQAALFKQQNPCHTISSCEVEQATYTPGSGCTVRYTLTLQGREAGETGTALVSAQAFASAAECAEFFHTYLEPLAARAQSHPDLRWFDRPVAQIEALALAVFAYPIDGDLPALLEVSDGARMLARLQPCLAEAALQAAPASTCRAELVDYGRQRRCTLRYRLGSTAGAPSETTLYGKLTGDGSGELAEAVSSALGEVGRNGGTGTRFGVARALAWLPDLQLSVLETLPGKDIISDLLKARLRDKPAPAGAITLEEALEACARIAAALHSSGLRLGPRRALSDELGRLAEALAQLARISPELGALLTQRYDQIAERAEQSRALPLCFNHGDFTAGQVLFEGSAYGLIDFDSVCQAEPALDIAQFLTYLTVGGQKSKRTPEETRALFAGLSDRFLDTYFTTAGVASAGRANFEARVGLYRSISLLRRVLRSWQKMKPSRIAGALAMMQATLEGQPAAV